MGKVSNDTSIDKVSGKGNKTMAKEDIKATVGLDTIPSDTKGYDVVENTNKKVKGDYAVTVTNEVDIVKAFKATSEENLFKAFKRDYVIEAQGLMRNKVLTELGLKTTKDKTPTSRVVEELASMVEVGTISQEQMDESLTRLGIPII